MLEDKRQEKITELNIGNYAELEISAYYSLNLCESYHLTVYSKARIPPNVSDSLNKGSKEEEKM